MLKSTGRSPSSLNIAGQRVALQKNPHGRGPSYNVKQISLSPVQVVSRDPHRQADSQPQRQQYKLHVSTYTNADVQGSQLRAIQEALEADDFRRFLKKPPVRRYADRVSSIDTKNFYHNNFQVHYNFLRNVIKINLQCDSPHDVQGVQMLIMDCKCKSVHSHVQPTDIDRKMLRETLYSEIFQRHRRSIFALGSFLRMLKTKKSNYNAIKQEADSE